MSGDRGLWVSVSLGGVHRDREMPRSVCTWSACLLRQIEGLWQRLNPFLLPTKNSVLGKRFAKDGVYPRCHLDSCNRHALSEVPAYFRQLTYALRRRILGSPFHCALCGPFGRLPSIHSHQVGLSVRAFPALISASTVYYTKLFYKLPHTYIFVKHFFQILLFTFFLIPYHPAVYFDIIPVETSS